MAQTRCVKTSVSRCDVGVIFGEGSNNTHRVENSSFGNNRIGVDVEAGQANTFHSCEFGNNTEWDYVIRSLGRSSIYDANLESSFRVARVENNANLYCKNLRLLRSSSIPSAVDQIPFKLEGQSSLILDNVNMVDATPSTNLIEQTSSTGIAVVNNPPEITASNLYGSAGVSSTLVSGQNFRPILIPTRYYTGIPTVEYEHRGMFLRTVAPAGFGSDDVLYARQSKSSGMQWSSLINDNLEDSLNTVTPVTSNYSTSGNRTVEVNSASQIEVSLTGVAIGTWLTLVGGGAGGFKLTFPAGHKVRSGNGEYVSIENDSQWSSVSVRRVNAGNRWIVYASQGTLILNFT